MWLLKGLEGGGGGGGGGAISTNSMLYSGVATFQIFCQWTLQVPSPDTCPHYCPLGLQDSLPVILRRTLTVNHLKRQN